MSEATTLPLGITLPRLNRGELQFLLSWADMKREAFPLFSQWIGHLAADELNRRQDESREPGSIHLPEFSDGAQAADFLLGSFVLVNLPITAGVARFADDVARKVVCDVAGHIETLGERFAL